MTDSTDTTKTTAAKSLHLAKSTSEAAESGCVFNCGEAQQFREMQGYREIPSLLISLANTASKKAVAEEKVA